MIELTEQQAEVIARAEQPPLVVDPRTREEFILPRKVSQPPPHCGPPAGVVPAPADAQLLLGVKPLVGVVGPPRRDGREGPDGHPPGVNGTQQADLGGVVRVERQVVVVEAEEPAVTLR
jgi:hypothetical protein